MSRQLVDQSDRSIAQEGGDVASAADRKLERRKKRKVKKERERQKEREKEKEGELERDRTTSNREKSFDLRPITEHFGPAAFISRAGKMVLEPTNHTTLLSHVMPVQSHQKPLPAMSQSHMTSHMTSHTISHMTGHRKDHAESKSKFGRDTRPRPGELSLR